jgi:hypothetical protein
MAKKKPQLPKADFYLYKPNPDDPGSLRAVPKEKAFGWKKQKVTFFNGNRDPIHVHFQSPLQASVNPLKVTPGHARTVTIDPVAFGSFPCLVEILATICPTCSSRLGGRHVLSLRPDSALGVDLPGHSWYEVDAGQDDADPIIKINP